jgi:hypothetical protein
MTRADRVPGEPDVANVKSIGAKPDVCRVIIKVNLDDIAATSTESALSQLQIDFWKICQRKLMITAKITIYVRDTSMGLIQNVLECQWSGK